MTQLISFMTWRPLLDARFARAFIIVLEKLKKIPEIILFPTIKSNKKILNIIHLQANLCVSPCKKQIKQNKYILNETIRISTQVRGAKKN